MKKGLEALLIIKSNNSVGDVGKQTDLLHRGILLISSFRCIKAEKIDFSKNNKEDRYQFEKLTFKVSIDVILSKTSTLNMVVGSLGLKACVADNTKIAEKLN